MEFGPSKNFSHTEFYLIGFTDLAANRSLLFIPFFILLLFSVSSNIALMFVIVKQRSLHSPMYVLIACIAFVDVGVPVAVVPRMILSFVSDINVFPRNLCLMQMWWVHYLCSFQSTILFGMAVDRLFAICLPLRYNEVMSYNNCQIVSAVIVIRNTIIITAMIALVGTLTFCSSNVFYGIHCEHQLVVTIACGDTRKNYLAGMLSFSVIVICDCFGIFFSYLAIFVVIFKSAGGESRSKAIHTCTTHLTVIAITFFTSMIAFMSFRVQHSITRDVRVLISLMYLLVPGVSNPLIYGIRTKEIREQLLKLLKCKKVIGK